MNENKIPEEELREPAPAQTAPEEAEEKTPDPLTADPKEPYVERPRGQRIFAWVLFGIMVVSVILYYYWIAKG